MLVTDHPLTLQDNPLQFQMRLPWSQKLCRTGCACEADAQQALAPFAAGGLLY